MRTIGVIGLLIFCLTVVWAQSVKIAPGDSIKISVEKEESISRVYRVDSQGNIQMPLLGLVKVGGLTEGEASQAISRMLREGQFIRDPKVKVEILLTERPTAVIVSGAVRKAGQVNLQPGWRLANALQVAEPTDQSDLTAVRLERVDGTLLIVNYLRFQQQNDSAGNPELTAGDRVFVPLQPGGQNVLVLGAVQNPGIIKYEEGMTVLSAIAKAGGATNEANLGEVRLKRKGQADTQSLDLNNLSSDTTVAAGDEITVAFKAVKEFVVARGAVQNPGIIYYNPGMTVTQVIEAAGGPASNARLDQVVIERPEPRKMQRIRVNLLEVAQGRRPDEPVKSGDTVDVPGPKAKASAAETLQVVSLVLSIIFLLMRR